MYTLVRLPEAAANFRHHPWASLGVVLLVLAIANIPRARMQGRPGQAFVSSCLTIVSVVFLFGMAIWPNLVVASNDPALSLTIRNASSSPATLRIMFNIALIGMPFVLGYTAVVYWTFRGRVKPDEESHYG
jgi:cytochrome d ubiquinol oxidase subunit II